MKLLIVLITLVSLSMSALNPDGVCDTNKWADYTKE